MKILKNMAVLCIVLLCQCAISQTFRVGSFNLRYDNPADSLNNWKYRKETVAKLIQFHDFDILGTQEGLQHMLDQLSAKLPEYSYIGVGRDDGKNAGEHSAIFYKKDKFQLLEKGDFWLAENPTYPHKGWDAVLPRICSWGKFKDKESGLVFYFFNTHFDHVGTTARKESSKLILKKIKEIAGNTPTLLTGDFNVDQTSPSYKILNESSLLTDAFDIAKLKYGSDGSFNGFKINTYTDKRIDHIFVTSNFSVSKHGILTDTYHTSKDALTGKADSSNFPKEVSLYMQEARLPSDHYPLLAIISFKK
ncbi:endonuclease/exonuclease/phosphatase family protein [Zhouia sp. PK063]|uniref:endonuclease/exonuclease/phosphatase family protein n=1 Tax=Zhouia sp. PK063 TaxID=3373602 RepID=UPI0037AE36AD